MISMGRMDMRLQKADEHGRQDGDIYEEGCALEAAVHCDLPELSQKVAAVKGGARSTGPQAGVRWDNHMMARFGAHSPAICSPA